MIDLVRIFIKNKIFIYLFIIYIYFTITGFILHFNTDVPLSLRCVLYVPEGKPG